MNLNKKSKKSYKNPQAICQYFCSKVIQFLFVAFLPPIIILGPNFVELLTVGSSVLNSIFINILSLTLSQLIQNRFDNFTQSNPLEKIFSIIFGVYFFVLIFLIFTRCPYSLKLLLIGLLFTTACLFFDSILKSKSKIVNFFVVPIGQGLNIKPVSNFSFEFLQMTKIPDFENTAILVDFSLIDKEPKWKNFLAQCSLHKINILSLVHFQEFNLGKVDPFYFFQNFSTDILPSKIKLEIKRFFDCFFIIVILPFILPILVLVSICICIESPGGALFIQKRMGFNGKHFNLVKFRSMYVNQLGKNFTEDSESVRITRVGKIIRKYRIDELPQFWNVLKGEMSLIGPRPESAELAAWYEKEVPFFSYRHIVRPGISGWAQVKHGYAAGISDMKDKVAYDFFYIKYFSFWLDLLICYKTLKTIFTGFGSR